MCAKKMNDKKISDEKVPERSLQILDRREVQKLQEILDKNYKSGFELKGFGVMLGSEERIWLAGRDVFTAGFDFAKLPVNSIGMNFGKLKRNDKLRLTIEGSQIVGKTAERNFALIADERAESFMHGQDVDVLQAVECEEHTFVIVKTENGTILGSALFAEGKLKNLLPKSRRIL